jgi:hypothetical protein
MMKSFPALRGLVWFFRLSAILSGIGALLTAFSYRDIVSYAFLGIVGVLSFLTLWAMGEIIVLILDWHHQQVLSTEAQIRMYQTTRDKPIIKPLKHARKSG